MDRERRAYSFWAKAGFVIYACLCFLMFVYLLFPYDVLRDRLEYAMQASFGLDVSLGHVKSRLPLGMAIDNLKIKQEPIAQDLIVSPSILGFLEGDLKLDFKSRIDEGRLKGMFATPIRGRGDSVKIVLNFDEVNIERFSKLIPEGSNIKGILSGNLSCSTSPGALYKASGNVSAVWKNGTMPLFISAFPLNELSFEMLEFEANMDKGLLVIDKVELSGDISGTVQGRIRVVQDISKSRLNLSGEAKLPQFMMSLLNVKQSGSDTGIKFSLGGTASLPRLRLRTR